MPPTKIIYISFAIQGNWSSTRALQYAWYTALFQSMDPPGSSKSDFALSDLGACSSTGSWGRSSGKNVSDFLQGRPPVGVAVPGYFVLPTSPPPMDSLASPLNSLLLSSTSELTSCLAPDPAVFSCGSLVTAVADVQDQAKPWGWLCPLQETTPATQVRHLELMLSDGSCFIKMY